MLGAVGNDLRASLADRVLVADGAMGTILQTRDVAAHDFVGHDGCNEILSLTRPDVVASVHRAYLDAGADCIETNTFGANRSALEEYGLSDRVEQLAYAGAVIARRAADEASTPTWPRYVLGSIGPGTKLPSLGQVPYAVLRDGYQAQAEAMIAARVDAFQIETSQDLLQVKAAVVGARRASRALGADLPVFVSVTMEPSGTMLLGTDIGAALTALAGLRVDAVGLNCGTGPAAMRDHLRHLARHAPMPLSCMPNAGLPELTPDGPRYPMAAKEFASTLAEYVTAFGLRMVGGCCGTTPAHIAALVCAVDAARPATRQPQLAASVSSLYSSVPLRQDTSFLTIGERTNANGSKAFREAMADGRLDDCVSIARRQDHDGAHLLDVCVDYAGRDGVADMRAIASRLATGVTAPIMLDSTEPAVIEAGLECLGGRCVVNSVNLEEGAGPGSRLATIMPMVVEHGAAVVALAIDQDGQARTCAAKVRAIERLIRELTNLWGLRPGDIVADCLTFPIGTGQDETRRDALETIAAIRELTARHPGLQTTLGVSNVSFGLKPAARVVLNSVFLAECVAAGLSSAIVHPSRILPLARIPDEQRQVALDVIYDRRADGYDPLTAFLGLFADGQADPAARRDEYAGLPVAQRLRRRIIDGDASGLEADLDEAVRDKPALDVVNDELLGAMKTVGELFGAGEMQLPFVLGSAEVMKKAIAHLRPRLDTATPAGRGTIVLATVAGDVHDIGKNLVDIILTNNGYTVVNLGVKQPLAAIVDAAVANEADAIGLSGLLVKSTLIMRDYLTELNRLGLARFPVLLGGAALTRSYVERDLSAVYEGSVRYARDAFEGLIVMEQMVGARNRVTGRGRSGAVAGETAAAPPEAIQRPVVAGSAVAPTGLAAVSRGPTGPTRPSAQRPRVVAPADPPRPAAPVHRSDVARRVAVPTPPWWGSRAAAGIPLDDVVPRLNRRALFAGQWGLKGGRGGRSSHELARAEGAPRLEALLDRLRTEGITDLSVSYGYWPCHSDGDALILGRPDEPGAEVARFVFPRQSGGRRLCLADYFRDADEAEQLGPDVVALQLVTVGADLSRATAELFRADRYRDYLELHGLGVALAEALAEHWHARVREELALDTNWSGPGHRGARYSFGYPACPNLEDRAALVRLLDPGRIGVTLTEAFQLVPEQSTDAIIVHHPEATYFSAR